MSLEAGLSDWPTNGRWGDCEYPENMIFAILFGDANGTKMTLQVSAVYQVIVYNFFFFRRPQNEMLQFFFYTVKVNGD